VLRGMQTSVCRPVLLVACQRSVRCILNNALKAMLEHGVLEELLIGMVSAPLCVSMVVCGWRKGGGI
jgi:hypothetical protein